MYAWLHAAWQNTWEDRVLAASHCTQDMPASLGWFPPGGAHMDGLKNAPHWVVMLCPRDFILSPPAASDWPMGRGLGVFAAD